MEMRWIFFAKWGTADENRPLSDDSITRLSLSEFTGIEFLMKRRRVYGTSVTHMLKINTDIPDFLEVNSGHKCVFSHI